MPTEWTLNASQITGGSNGQKLVGCHIIQNTDNYTFTKPDNTVLATSSGPPRPTASFTFPSFDHKDVKDWVITMSAPPTDTNQNWTGCSWSNGDVASTKDTTPESGEFTAQSGGTVLPDEASEKAASSGKAY
jgi:hypothetical protein